jgi:hypothetical protein
MLGDEWDKKKIDQHLGRLIEDLGKEYSFFESKDFPSVLEYELLKNYEDKNCLLALKFSRYGYLPFHILFIHVSYKYGQLQRYGDNTVAGDDIQIYGCIKVGKDFGNVLIRPETLEDKIHELIDHQEILFPGFPSFNHKYYVLASDREKLKSAMSSEMISAIEPFNGLYIEIHNDMLLAGFKRNVDNETASDLITFLSEISSQK